MSSWSGTERRSDDGNTVSTSVEAMPDESRPAWLVLRGNDVVPSRPAPKRSRVVLLHGWLQEHSSWLKTGMALRDVFGHDVSEAVTDRN